MDEGHRWCWTSELLRRSWGLIKTGLLLLPSPALLLFLMSRKIKGVPASKGTPHDRWVEEEKKAATYVPQDIWHPLQATLPNVHCVPVKEGDAGDPGGLSNKGFLSPEASPGPREAQQRGGRYFSEKVPRAPVWGPISRWHSSFICLIYLDLKSGSLCKKGMKPTVAKQKKPLAAMAEPHPLSYPNTLRPI